MSTILDARHWTTGALCAAALVTCASSASAFERQWHLGGGAGIAALRESKVGPAVSIHGAYGLTDMFDVQLELLASRHGGSDGTDVFSASAGFAYKIDVLQWVPYVFVTGGYYNYAGVAGPNGESGSEGGASLGAGLDYLITRRAAVGVQVRQHASFSDGFELPYFNAVAVGEYRWGW